MTAAIAPSNFVVHSPTPVDNPTLLNLLIVDDERGVREACREAAATLGYRATGRTLPSRRCGWLTLRTWM